MAAALGRPAAVQNSSSYQSCYNKIVLPAIPASHQRGAVSKDGSYESFCLSASAYIWYLLGVKAVSGLSWWMCRSCGSLGLAAVSLICCAAGLLLPGAGRGPSQRHTTLCAAHAQVGGKGIGPAQEVGGE